MAYLTPRPIAGSGVASAHPAGNGFVVHNKGHAVARSLLAGPGVAITHPEGLGGNPQIAAGRQNVLFEAKGVECAALTETAMEIAISGARYFKVREVLFTNATGVAGALRSGLYTMENRGGVALLPSTQSYVGLVDDLNDGLVVEVAAALRGKRASPYLYFFPTIANAVPMTMDIYVIGDVLEMEI